MEINEYKCNFLQANDLSEIVTVIQRFLSQIYAWKLNAFDKNFVVKTNYLNKRI